ncbi:MAG: serine/threonine protein kinase [Muribaculaceae bacterium]|nr:serine/threonine protein kinase [Muribaculaceae bacterium]
MMQLRAGSELQDGKYRIIRVLGQGGFGITYLAEHTMLDKLVAIKEFFPKEYCDRVENTSHVTIGTKNSVEIVEMLKGKFIKEAKNISKLRHPNIITIHDIFQENDTAYYVMEYVDGTSLSQMVKEQGALPEDKVIGYIKKVADAVGYMHSLSMNHLDLKPANIMVRSSDDEPILIDFGLSKQYDSSGGQTSTTPVGISHGFAPIEQYRPGGVATFTPQTDIYALGATLFNLLSDSVPPHYSEILEDGLPKLPTSISQRTVDAVEHAMEIKKNKRPATVKDFIQQLLKETPIPENKQEVLKRKQDSSNIIKDSSGIRVLKDDSHKSIDETMMIGDFTPIQNISAVDKSLTIDNIEFVDLGLSVKWANMNIGAKSLDEAGQFFSKRMDGNLNDLYQWNTQGAIVPSIEHFQELITRCKWYWSEIKESTGYTIIGPNGNRIQIPVTGDGIAYPGRNIITFGLLWTNEALLNEWRSQCLLLYYNSASYSLNSYSTDKNCPIRLVLR